MLLNSKNRAFYRPPAENVAERSPNAPPRNHYNNKNLPRDFHRLVQQSLLVRQSAQAEYEIAQVLWSYHQRKNHIVDADYKSISYRELYRRFGRCPNAPQLLDSGFFTANSIWQIGITRKFGITPLGESVIHEYRRMITDVTITPPLPNPQLSTSTPPNAFKSRDINGNSRKGQYPIRPLVKINLAELRKAATDPAKTETEKTAAVQLLAMAPDGFLHQQYIEHTGARFFIHGAISLQNIPGSIRDCALAGSHDYDISNCYPAIYQQVARRMKIKTPRLDSYIQDKNKFTETLRHALNCSEKQIKKAILALAHFAGTAGIVEASRVKNDASLPAWSETHAEHFLKHESIAQLKNELRAIAKKWIAEGQGRAGKTLVNAMRKGIARNKKQSVLISHLLQGVEAKIMEVCRRYYSEVIALLMHDGFVTTQTINKDWLQKKIKQETGFSVQLKRSRLKPTSQQVKCKRCEQPEPAQRLAEQLNLTASKTVKGGVGLGLVEVGCVCSYCGCVVLSLEWFFKTYYLWIVPDPP